MDFKDKSPYPEHCKTCKKREQGMKDGLTPNEVCSDCKYPIDRFEMLVDLTELHRKMKRVHLSMGLGLSSTDDLKDYSILRWLSPNVQEPDDCSYILLKCYDFKQQMYFVCAASYESGHYLDVLAPNNTEINRKVISGWCYYPYDNHT